MQVRIMVSSNQTEWKDILTIVLKNYRIYWTFSVDKLLEKVIASVINGLFRLSVIAWKMNGIGIETSALAPYCDILCFSDVKRINWVVSRVLLSSCTTVSGWINCCNSWFRSTTCFRNNWFAALILFWCCSFQRSISSWVWFNEKTSVNCCSRTNDGFCVCSVNYSE